MKRKTIFQFTLQPWFPRFLKTQVDEFLDFMVRLVRANRPFLPLFDEVLSYSRARTLVGLDAMDGGGLAHIVAEVDGDRNAELSVLLMDEHQRPSRVRRLLELAGRPVEFVTCSKEQAAERVRGRGVGVFLNNFHRFGHGEDRAALQNLVEHELDVVVGEGNNKSVRQVIGMTVFVPLFVLLGAPFIKPFRLSRLLFTYLLPVLPLVIVWEGVTTLFRLHTPEELEALAKSLGREDYVWKAGKRENGRGGFVIYLIGYRTS